MTFLKGPLLYITKSFWTFHVAGQQQQWFTCSGYYLNKGVLAIHSLANGQSFGDALSGGHDGALGQTLLQLF